MKNQTKYRFTVYENPLKYSSFSLTGKKKYDIMKSKLLKDGYWFVVEYRKSEDEKTRKTQIRYLPKPDAEGNISS